MSYSSWRHRAANFRALAQLVERWQQRVIRHAFELTGRHDLAADVAQESWISVAKGLRRLDDPACFPRWLLRIVSHKCADAIRELQRRGRLAEQIADKAPQSIEPTSDDTSDDVTALRRAIASLPGDRRALVTMFYWDELSIAEIAHILTVPLGTVKSRLHHTKQELKQILERSKP